VDVLEVRGGQVEILLRGDERRVAEHFLNEANVHSVIQAMRSATVAQDMRVYSRDAGASCGLHDQAVHPLPAKAEGVWLSLRQLSCVRVWTTPDPI